MILKNKFVKIINFINSDKKRPISLPLTNNDRTFLEKKIYHMKLLEN